MDIGSSDCQLYHRAVASLFRSIDQCFRDSLTPVDASAEDVEEERFELVCFGHGGCYLATTDREVKK
jgi:hypothetical protein